MRYRRSLQLFHGVHYNSTNYILYHAQNIITDTIPLDSRAFVSLDTKELEKFC
uniref:Uncharacterized protein n=1 Tax=Rhizophagus irregularis (strain DAOM 181602 / DAOM 197198 / MUCL 43194) TaxID=747089 RepID=U9TG87_RHIID